MTDKQIAAIEAAEVADALEAEYLAVANGAKKPSQIVLEPMVRAVSVIRELAFPIYSLTEGARDASAQQDEREAVTDAMVYAFHRSMSDGALGEADFNEIRDGLRAAMQAGYPYSDPLLAECVEALERLLRSYRFIKPEHAMVSDAEKLVLSVLAKVQAAKEGKS